MTEHPYGAFYFYFLLQKMLTPCNLQVFSPMPHDPVSSFSVRGKTLKVVRSSRAPESSRKDFIQALTEIQLAEENMHERVN